MADLSTAKQAMGKVADIQGKVGSAKEKIGVAKDAANAVNAKLNPAKNTANAAAPSPAQTDSKKADVAAIKNSMREPFEKNISSKFYVQFILSSIDPNKPSTSVLAYLPEEISLDIQARYATPFGEGLLPMDSFVTKAVRTFGVSGISREMSLKVWEGTDGITVSLPLTFTPMDNLMGTRKNSDSILPQILDLVSMCAPSKKKEDFFLNPPGPVVTFDTKKIVSVYEKVKTLALDTIMGDGNSNTNDSEVKTVETETPENGAIAAINSIKSKIAEFSKDVGEAIFAFESKISVYIGDFLYFDNVVIDSVSQQYSTIFNDAGEPIYANVNVQFTTMFSPTIQDIYDIFKKKMAEKNPPQEQGESEPVQEAPKEDNTTKS